MDSFISKVVGHILTQEGTFSNKTVVLPSQRACVFLKQELINQVKAPFQLPKIVSIEQYIQELADVSLIDNTQLLFEFYSIYLKEIPKKKEQVKETSPEASVKVTIDRQAAETKP